MNPLLLAALRRHWPVVGAAALAVLFLLMHVIWYAPLQGRYRAALRKAETLGLAVDADRSPPTVTPRLFALFSANSLGEAAAQEEATSGALTASLLEDLTRAASRNGLEVLTAEQAPVTPQGSVVTVRAHLKLQSSYRGFVGMLGTLAQGGTLTSVDRFVLNAPGSSASPLEVWASRCVLKRKEGTP